MYKLLTAFAITALTGCYGAGLPAPDEPPPVHYEVPAPTFPAAPAADGGADALPPAPDMCPAVKEGCTYERQTDECPAGQFRPCLDCRAVGGVMKCDGCTDYKACG